MTAALVSKILEAGLLLWLVLLMLVVVGRMTDGDKGDIPSRGLLAGESRRAGKETQPERAVVVLVAPLVLGLYILNALSVDITAVPPGMRPSLPDVPGYLVALLTGSNSLYLAGKLIRSP